jgi:predicted nucleic acid-binding protein
VRLYLDANAIIYVTEAVAPYFAAVVARIAEADAAPGGIVLTSRLARLECRLKPLRNQDAVLLAAYDEFFASDPMLLIDIDADIIERATDLRARYNVKTPDAIHLAAAWQQQADVFLTGDAALARCREVPVEVL